MRGFLGVTVSPDAPTHLRTPVERALDCLRDDDAAVDRVDRLDDGWLAFAGADPYDLFDDAGDRFTVRLGRAVRTRAGDVPAADLAKLIDNEAGLVDLLPPFAAAHRAGRAEPVVVAGDWLGFRQLYWWQGDGVAAVSTSARALAVLAGGELDPRGLGAQALIGWQVGDATIFAGVRVVPPGTVARLAAGSVALRRYAEPPSRPERVPGLDEAVEEMAAILRTWQTTYLEDHPDAVLQLTGGHDSRILLAAIPAKLRRGLHAFTLGDGHTADERIAAQLSAREGIDHFVYDFSADRWPSPREAHELALKAARALECQASPLALAPLLLAEAQIDQGHRLSGLGGEVARGFYYAGQPNGATTSDQLVERLARWRLFSNEAVEEAALDSGFHDRSRATTLSTLDGLFTPGDWLRATDEFYLLHRMHRWAGVHGTVAAVRRHVINPMFDRRFVELALAVAPEDKRDSRLLGRLLCQLDPELARIPLDSGLVPARLAYPSAATRLTTRAQIARKAARKVRQRLSGTRKPQFGAGTAADLVLTHWRENPAACAPLREAPALNQRWLDGVLAGGPAQATTVAFLVNLLAASS